VLFVKDKFHWPRSSGGDIDGSQMARTLAARGHTVDAATFAPSNPEAVAGLGLRRVIDLARQSPTTDGIAEPGQLQRRFERYLGADLGQLPLLAGAVRDGDYDAVAVLGVNSIPPVEAAFAVWLSRAPADGCGSRPACSRTRSRRASFTRRQVPSLVHWR